MRLFPLNHYLKIKAILKKNLVLQDNLSYRIGPRVKVAKDYQYPHRNQIMMVLSPNLFYKEDRMQEIDRLEQDIKIN